MDEDLPSGPSAGPLPMEAMIPQRGLLLLEILTSLSLPRLAFRWSFGSSNLPLPALCRVSLLEPLPNVLK